MIIFLHHFGQPVCIVISLFLLTIPQNDHVYTSAACKKNINPRSLKTEKASANSPATVLCMGKTEVVFIQPCAKGRQPVITVGFAQGNRISHVVDLLQIFFGQGHSRTLTFALTRFSCLSGHFSVVYARVYTVYGTVFKEYNNII